MAKGLKSKYPSKISKSLLILISYVYDTHIGILKVTSLNYA